MISLGVLNIINITAYSDGQFIQGYYRWHRTNPPTTVTPTTDQAPPTTYLKDNRPPTKGTTDQRLWKNRPLTVKKPTTDTITVVKPPTRLRLLSHRPHRKYALFIAQFFCHCDFMVQSVFTWMVQVLICQVKSWLINLSVLQSWIMTVWLLVAFWDKMCEVHVTQSSQWKVQQRRKINFGKVVKNVISSQSYWRTPLNEWIWMKLNIQNVKTWNTKELLRAHSRLKYGQLAHFASCVLGALLPVRWIKMLWVLQYVQSDYRRC